MPASCPPPHGAPAPARGAERQRGWPASHARLGRLFGGSRYSRVRGSVGRPGPHVVPTSLTWRNPRRALPALAPANRDSPPRTALPQVRTRRRCGKRVPGGEPRGSAALRAPASRVPRPAAPLPVPALLFGCGTRPHSLESFSPRPAGSPLVAGSGRARGWRRDGRSSTARLSLGAAGPAAVIAAALPARCGSRRRSAGAVGAGGGRGHRGCVRGSCPRHPRAAPRSAAPQPRRRCGQVEEPGAPPPPERRDPEGMLEKKLEKGATVFSRPRPPRPAPGRGGLGKESPGNFLFLLARHLLKWHATRRRNEKRTTLFLKLNLS